MEILSCYRAKPPSSAACSPLAGLSLACSNSEAPAEDHDPTTFTITVNNVVMTDDTIRLTLDATDTVHFTFYNAANDNLDDVEGQHYSLLTFSPATGITEVVDPAHHYRSAVTVTGIASGTAGDVTLGFGHDALADEHSFPLAYLVQ